MGIFRQEKESTPVDAEDTYWGERQTRAGRLGGCLFCVSLGSED